MSTSGDTTFDCSRDEIITDALINVGALGPGDSASGALLVYGSRLLNRVVKAIDADGKFLWRIVRRSQTLTDGTASYTLGTDVLDVEEPLNFRRASASSTARSPVRYMSHDDYAVLPDRTIEGIPTQYTLEFTLPTTVTLLLYPVPDTTNDVIEYRAVTRAQDYDSGSNTGDFPARWLNCLVYGLTAEMAPGFGQAQLAGQMRRMFLEEKERQMAAGDERGPTWLVPWGGF